MGVEVIFRDERGMAVYKSGADQLLGKNRAAQNKTGDTILHTTSDSHKRFGNCISFSQCGRVLHGRPLGPCGRMVDVNMASSNKSKLYFHSE